MILILLAVSTFFSSVAEVIPTPSSNINSWYSRGVFYELFVRSFKDSNGDRYGDLNGVISKLDYLKGLGISALWLMPINDSAERTNNYDPIDMKAIDPTYGTMADFQNLLKEAHQRGIKIILDFVMNHTSDQHPYFLDAKSNKRSKYRNWYVFRDTKPSGSWEKYWVECETGWYYAYFARSKPDLNFKNPEVLEYYKDVVRFWLDLGVDGFRFDAVTLLVENGPDQIKHQPESFQIFREIRKLIDTTYPDREIFTVAESEPPYNDYLGSGDDMFHAVFNFKFNNTILRTIKQEKPYTNKCVSMIETIAKQYAKELSGKKGGFYGIPLSNHDTYAGNRPFQQLGQNLAKTKLAGAVYLTLPGIPFVYYGEEIAMDTYTRSKSDRWLRTCMIWEDLPGKNYGFGTADKLWNHLNAGDDEINQKFNVEVQDKDPDSILNLYRKLIHIRNEQIALSLGDFESLSVDREEVIAYLRKYEEEELIVVHNFSGKKLSVSVLLNDSQALTFQKEAEDLLHSEIKIKISGKKLKLTGIAPYQTLILTAK